MLFTVLISGLAKNPAETNGNRISILKIQMSTFSGP